MKVDKRKRFMFRLAPNGPRPYGPPQGPDEETFAVIAAAERPDPLNPKRWADDAQSVDLPRFRARPLCVSAEGPRNGRNERPLAQVRPKNRRRP